MFVGAYFLSEFKMLVLEAILEGTLHTTCDMNSRGDLLAILANIKSDNL